MALVRAAVSFGSRAALHAPRCAAASSSSFSAPLGRRWMSKYYLPSHEYISVSGGVGTVGISDYAQKALGDVVYVELPDVGDKFAAGESFGSVESVKAASDVYVPVDGEVVETNSELADTPSTVNEDPEGSGWFIKVKVSDDSQLKKLMDEAAYAKFCKEQQH